MAVRNLSINVALFIASALLCEPPRSALGDGAARASAEAPQIWSVDLGGEVTGACAITYAGDRPGYFAAADGKLVALTDDGHVKPAPPLDAKGPIARVPVTVERLVPIHEPGKVAFVGYKNWGEELVFFDKEGRALGKKQLGGHGIDWIAVDKKKLLIGFNGSGGLHLYQMKPASTGVDLSEAWSVPLGNCWNVALGDLGKGRIAASSDASGKLWLISADGKRRESEDFGYVTSLEIPFSSPSESTIVAINDVSNQNEEIVAVRGGRILFRARIGKNTIASKVCWRYRRLVGGRFVGPGPEVAVLRGDGSVVVFDEAGHPLSVLPPKQSRIAIECGPPNQGHDSLLSCEVGALRRVALPEMSREAAASLAESRDPLEDLLRIRAEDSSDELWARAVWLSSCGASSDQVARVFGAALSRAKKRAPIYVSFGDALTALGLFDSLSGGMELVVGRLTADSSAHAKDLEHAPNEQERAKVLEKVFSDSFKKSANQLLTQLLKKESGARQKAAACYLAAVAEDPEYKPAWQRLAFLLKGAPRDQVVADFVRRDPDNALPYYLRAIAEIDRGDLGAALSSVQLGNGKTVCRTYPGPCPPAVGLHYQDDDPYREFGIVGRPVPSTALCYVVDTLSTNWTQTAKEMRKIPERFQQRAELLRKAGKIPSAIAWWEAEYRAGLKLVKVEPRQSLLMLEGLGWTSDAYRELKHAYADVGNEAALKQLEQSHHQLRQLANALSKMFSGQPKTEETKAIFLGQKDKPAEERQGLEQALLKSGLIGRRTP
jgi:tetratricopeptide (TPR) repeat protein